MVLRDRDGSIRAFHNVCRHRGARLLDGAGNCPATITCPYHGWTYRHDGGLIGMPVRDSFPGLEPRGSWPEAGARRHRASDSCSSASRGDPPPVAKTWGKLARRARALSARGDGAARARSPRTCGTSIGKSRWTTTSSPITCRSAIPGLYRMFTPDYEDQALGAGRRARRQLDARAALLALVRAPVPVAHRQGRRAPAGDAAPLLALLQRAAEPGHRRVPGSDGFLPAAARRSRQVHRARTTCSACRIERRELRAVRFLSNRINTQVNNEDKWLCERVQRGLASSSYKPGPLSTHRGLDARVPRSAARADPGVSAALRAEAVRLADNLSTLRRQRPRDVQAFWEQHCHASLPLSRQRKRPCS